jgi:hypothetical protein
MCSEERDRSGSGSSEAGPPGHRREDAWRLLTEWTQGDSLRKHALAV